ncbi:unnamed protein product, partial [Brugia timori]|uniref:Aquarius_N domain-containing protein n=1 Tax=Brugia timori TaxID=42155 RepID=A0A0R3Q5X1_9BILA
MTVGSVMTTKAIQIARQYWAPYSLHSRPFDPNLVDAVYKNELLQNLFMQKKVVVLEFSQYL